MRRQAWIKPIGRLVGPRVSALRASRGYTLVELTVAVFLAFLVVLALGRLMLASQRSWEWGRDKAVLQQNATEALEEMARSVRAARLVAVDDTTHFETYDELGHRVHSYARTLVGGHWRLQLDGHDLVDRDCVRFRVDPDGDTTSLTILVELTDRADNRVAAMTRSAVRNRPLEF